MNFKFDHFSPKYQGYSLTFWLKMAHFHHLSICNQNEWISILVICRQNTKAIALFFWPKMAQFHHLSICNQNESISLLVIFRQNTKAIALLFGQTWLIFITCQSAIKMNEFQFWSFFAKIPRLWPYFLASHASFSSLFNLQSKWMNFNFGHFSPKYQGYSLIFLAKNGSISSLINLQSKWINFTFGHFSPKYQGYSLTFWPNMAHFHHFSICNQNEWISIWSFFAKIPRL